MCWLLGSYRAVIGKTDELKGEIVELKKENEEKENGRNTWEVKCRQLEMHNKLLKSKCHPQIIAEAKWYRRRLLEATTVDPAEAYCAIYDDNWDGDIWKQPDPDPLPSGPLSSWHQKSRPNNRACPQGHKTSLPPQLLAGLLP